MSNAKNLIKRGLLSCQLAKRLLQALASNYPRVFVYHRFAPAGAKWKNRISADIFGWQLDQMANFGRLLTFAQWLEEYLALGRLPSKAVVVTVDDGYSDFHQYAFPELHKRGLPATLYPAVNFIQREIWLWPDRLHASLETKITGRLTVTAHGGHLKLTWKDDLQRAKVWKELSALCVTLPDELRQAVIREVEEGLNVQLPKYPPEAYSPCNWDQLIEIADAGIEIGSHGMNHPILSKISGKQLETEVAESKAVLEQRLMRPVKTFCYPNSRPGDINEQVVAAVKSAGYIGGVFGTDLGSFDIWRIPRMGGEGDAIDTLWKLYGGEALGLRWR